MAGKAKTGATSSQENKGEVYMNSDLRDKLAIINKLKKKCRDVIKKKPSFNFYPLCNHLTIKPISYIDIEGYRIKLRYSSQFDTPFVDEQHSDEPVRVEMTNLSRDENISILNGDTCKLMFLMLHKNNIENGAPSDGKVSFYLDDPEKTATQAYEIFEMEDEARKLIRESDIDTVRAAYYASTGEETSHMSNIELRTELILISKEDPEDVIEAFADKKTAIKFKYKTAITLGLLYTNPMATELKAEKTGNTILNISIDADMEDEFAVWCLNEEEGQKFLKKLESDLKK